MKKPPANYESDKKEGGRELLDRIDREILHRLMENARLPYLELARELHVSSGTIHVRVEKMKKMGIITGQSLQLDYKKLGLDVCCFIGIRLKTARDYQLVVKNLHLFDEVVEAYYTTGTYSLFIKVMTQSIEKLHFFLSNKLQHIQEIQSTETFISLDAPIQRDIVP